MGVFYDKGQKNLRYFNPKRTILKGTNSSNFGKAAFEEVPARIETSDPHQISFLRNSRATHQFQCIFCSLPASTTKLTQNKKNNITRTSREDLRLVQAATNQKIKRGRFNYFFS